MTTELQLLNLSDLRPNPYNFRQQYGGPEFDELVESIQKHGVIQPILVRPQEGDTPYEIVFGERRWRAARAGSNRKGGKKTIPAMLRELSDDEAFDLMVIENLQREDLNEFEEAKGFRAYLDRNGKEAVQDLADRCKINPAYIRRRVSVLGLPEEVLEAWGDGEIAYGYLEQLARLDDEKEILEYFEEIIDGWEISTIKDLKESIDNQAIGLENARFGLDIEGCLACAANSDVQVKLFEIDAQDARCGNPKCFQEKQHAWLLSNWEDTDIHESCGTNGFRFQDDVNRDTCRRLHSNMVGTECYKCPDFVTVFSGPKLRFCYRQACVGDVACYKKTTTRANNAGCVGSSADGVAS